MGAGNWLTPKPYVKATKVMTTVLSTDLYELTMAAGYYANQVSGLATFELYVRELPQQRSFLVAAGLDQALDYLETLSFKPEEIQYLRSLPELERVPADFFDRYLPSFRFTGEVWAVAEGTPVFGQEPLLRVTAPVVEAQIVETVLLAAVLFPTSIASKATRVVEAAQGRPVIEFGGRRAHGTDAAMSGARAAFIGGCDATSNVEAGYRFGLPLSGTMAHSWVMMFEHEVDAFQRWEALYADRTILLIDTYDTLEAARRIVAAKLHPAAVRLDSGDVAMLSREVRKIFDAGELRETKIFVSGDLDEYRIATLLETGAPIDGFGVGTALSTSSDVPALGGIYKLVETERAGVLVPTMKLSVGKRTYPGRKQVWRVYERGQAAHDLIGRSDEAGPAGGAPLLQRVVRDGRRVGPSPPLLELRAGARSAVAQLPPAVLRLEDPGTYPVRISQALGALTRRVAGAVT